MSFQYDQYLARHRANVKRGFDWLSENLPGLMTNTLTAGWNTEFAACIQSKKRTGEYEAYDAYFYGNNRSYEVVQRYQRAWLLHIHRNPHHWQHLDFLFMMIWKMANWRPFWKCHTITSSR